MTAMFTRMDDDERARVEAAFKALEDILYAKMDSSALSAPPPKRPP